MTASAAWQHQYNVAAGSSQQSDVVSMFQLGNIPGALFTFLLVDRIGRVRSIQLLCLVWIVGTTVWITSNGSVTQTLAGRFIAGIGVGGFTVTSPTFLAEVAPRTVRGLAMTIYSSSVYIGVVIGYGANLGAQRGFGTLDARVWKVPVAVNFIYAGLFLVANSFVRESPRAMAAKGQQAQGLQTLAWYRNMSVDHPFVQEEWAAIMDEVESEQRAKHGKTVWHLLKELFTQPANLKKLLIVSLSIQILSQWSGAGSLTIYIHQILQLVGLSASKSSYMAVGFGIVKLVSAMSCSFFLIDALGRRKSVFIGITLQTLAALYLCIYMAEVGGGDGSKTLSQHAAGIVAITMIFLSGIGWAMGFNAIQYLIGTEIWQTELRAVATSLIMAAHYANQYGSSRALQPMLHGMQRWGLFAFWTVVGVVSIVYIALLIPETSGRSLESMDALFHGPWYKMGMATATTLVDDGVDGSVTDDGLEGKKEHKHGVRTTVMDA